ncbi:unnamed protein product [Caenorhabditis sp. 36 PRJEB53466]|nr:unnamed protein product [Caenorhabditis sp. 36 PRJEB53466]
MTQSVSPVDIAAQAHLPLQGDQFIGAWIRNQDDDTVRSARYQEDHSSRRLAYGQKDTDNDRPNNGITVEWTNTLDGAAKHFRRE